MWSGIRTSNFTLKGCETFYKICKRMCVCLTNDQLKEVRQTIHKRLLDSLALLIKMIQFKGDIEI